MLLRQFSPPEFVRYLARDPALATAMDLTALWFDPELIDAWKHQDRTPADTPPFLLPQLCSVDGQGIGTIGIKEPAGTMVLIGYGISPHHRTRGHATKAVALLLDWLAREHPEFKTVRAHVDGGNVASQRVLEKNGFRLIADNPTWNIRTYDHRRN